MDSEKVDSAIESKKEDDTSYEVTLVAENERFIVDRRLLIEKCDYFKAMFNGDYKESSEPEISIQILTAAAMEYILEFFKNGVPPTFDLDKASEIIKAANYLHLDKLQKIIEDKLLSLVELDTCFPILQLAKECELSKLEATVKSYALYSFPLLTEHIQQIKDLNSLYAYLAHENLNANSEYDVLFAGLKWLKQHNQINQILVVLGCILFKKVDKITFQKIANECKLAGGESVSGIISGISSLYDTNHLIDQKNIESALKNVESETRKIIIQLISSDKSRIPALKPYVVMNSKKKRIYEVMEFHVGNSELVEFIPIPESQWWGQSIVGWKGFNIITLCGKLKLDNQWNNEIKVYNCLTKKWTVLPTFMPVLRRHATVVINENTIYIMGGFGCYRSILTSAHTYNIDTGEWNDLPDLPERSSCVVANFHQGKLFVSGENLYVLESDCWKRLFHLPIRHSAIISHDNLLYFSGKWHRKLFCMKYDGNKSNYEPSDLRETATSHNNIIGICKIGEMAYIFSGGEDFEDVISVEMCELKENSEPTKTDLLWSDKNCKDKFYSVSSCFTLSTLDVKDSLINDCGLQWIE